MRTLYHFPLSPFSRKVRIVLKEKKLDFDPVIENFWERRRDFIAMNPAAQVPVLMESGTVLLADSIAICEYLEEQYGHPLIGKTAIERAEVRRIAGWFNNKFYYEVTKYILDEKVFKHFRKQGSPNSNAIRAAKNNIHYHLDYIAFLVKQRKWLGGEKFSLADITAAAQLSVLDYLGDVPWDYNSDAKEWYALIKSRPSFRPLLEDRIAGFAPPAHYDNPDF
ncbi:MAG: glutathione S-transferase family protein [Rickettsiales bacterium]|nr:glutathione S-transferase family protein [Rickettsiales bacterium]